MGIQTTRTQSPNLDENWKKNSDLCYIIPNFLQSDFSIHSQERSFHPPLTKDPQSSFPPWLLGSPEKYRKIF